MRIAALRKEPGKAPAQESAPRPLPALRKLPPVPKPASSTDYEPPPLRLGRADLDQLRTSSLSVSSPHDAAEREAGRTASKIVRMPARPDSRAYLSTATNRVFRLVRPASDHEPLTIKERGSAFGRSALTIPLIARSPAQDTIQRQTASDSRRSGRIAANINASMSTGEPLPIGVRQFMEPRFGADFSNVRIHQSSKAAALNKQLNARAFTTRNHVFFGQDKFKPESVQGKELIAHELTHTIQQGAAVQQRGRLQRSEDVTVVERPSAKIHGLWGVDSVLDYFADKANLIPGFRMFTVILGVNPINMSSVDRSAANILRAMIEVMPGGSLVSEALANHGIFDKVGTFVEQQVDALGMVGSTFKQAIDQFIEGFDLTDLADPGGLWDRAKSIFTAPIDQLIDFAAGLVSGIVDLIKEVILKPIAQLAEGTEGYALLKAVMGKDPITGDPYPQTAENIIGPFLKLIGQDEIWQNMQKSGAIPKCFAWFQGVLSELMGFVNEIPGLFVKAFTELELADIVLVPRAFAKLAGVFGDFLGRFTSWVGDKIWKLLEIIFDVVSPGAWGYIQKTGAALKSILQNPLPFVGNLVKAAKLGFQNFAGNIVTHLKRGLLDWLTGSLEGVYIPTALSLPEMGKFALSVLGITWAQIRAKIVKALGPNGETIMRGLETAFDIVVALVKGGPAAAWELIKDKLTSLKDQVVSGIISFITRTIVTKAIPKLIAMFIPGAGFISAIISIYDTIMVFVEKIKKIKQVVTAFIDSIVAIAGGSIGAAAGKVESILSGLLSLAISFLAGFVGLGRVADKVREVVTKVRETVDKAIDTAITWIVTKAKALFAKLFGKGKDKGKDKGAEDATYKEGFAMGPEDHSVTVSLKGKDLKVTMASGADLVLGTLISKAMSEVAGDPARDDNQKKAILGHLTAAKFLVDNIRTEYDQAGKPEAFETFARPRVAKIVGKLAVLAKYKPPITSLEKVIAIGKPRYVPPGYNIRKNLYDRATGGAWTALSKKLRSAHITALSPKLFQIWKLRDDPSSPTNYAAARNQWDALQSAKEIPVKKAPSFASYDHAKHFSTFGYETDHKTPLGTSWNSGEKNSDDAARSATTLNSANLEVLTEEANQAKSGVGFNRDVGPDFSSGVGASPKGSATIDGQPFADK